MFISQKLLVFMDFHVAILIKSAADSMLKGTCPLSISHRSYLFRNCSSCFIDSSNMCQVMLFLLKDQNKHQYFLVNWLQLYASQRTGLEIMICDQIPIALCHSVLCLLANYSASIRLLFSIPPETLADQTQVFCCGKLMLHN